MVKKRIQEIWHAGLEDFAARRERVQAARDAALHNGARPPSRRSTALEREADEQVRRAVLAATVPLRQELDALKAEVAALRELVEEGTAGVARKQKAPGRKH